MKNIIFNQRVERDKLTRLEKSLTFLVKIFRDYTNSAVYNS